MTKSPTSVTSDDRIQIVFQNGDIWHVKFFLSSLEDSAREEMIHRLREAKKLIAENFEVIYERLEMLEVLHKAKLTEGVEALVSIGLMKVGQGKPVVQLKPGISAKGAVFSDMIAELDFYCIDEFDHPITLERIKTVIARSGVAENLCNFKAIKDAVERVHKTKGDVQGLIIARGVFPDEGIDAQLEYTFYTTHSDEMEINEFIKGRKVKDGDILCQKIPPTKGVKEGIDIRGGKIPPIHGLDFDLIQGSGTKLSGDKNTLTALLDGIAAMKRFNRRVYTLSGERIVPCEIEVNVKPVMKINADEIDDLVTEDSIEIEGTLKEGAKVTTKGELYLNGNIAAGATIMAGSLVMINGEIHKSEVSSDSSIITSSGAQNAEIKAANNIEMRGLVENSKIIAQNVSLGGARGSRIVAGKRAFLGFAQSDGHGNQSKIEVGYLEFYQNKLETTSKEIATLKTYLNKFGEIFGKKIVSHVNDSNMQLMMIQHLRNLRKTGEDIPDKKKIDCMRKLMESIIPLKGLLKNKQLEIKQLQTKLKQTHDGQPVLVIREKITDQIDITINGEAHTINQEDS